MRRANDVSLTRIPHIGRATLLGMVLGWVIIAVPVSIGMIVLGADSDAIMFASHAGFFGGMGFGGMLGAVIQADRFERGRTGHLLAPSTDRSEGGERERVDHAA